MNGTNNDKSIFNFPRDVILCFLYCALGLQIHEVKKDLKIILWDTPLIKEETETQLD